MFKVKLVATLMIVLAVLFGQVGGVLAAPANEDAPAIEGTIQSITLETDSEGVTTVVVTVLDDLGATQTVRLSVETALTLGLVTLDPTTGEPIVDETKIGQTVSIDPTTVIPEEEVDVHPIAALIAAFFGEDPTVVNEYHEDGFGFGVIAQAFWIAEGLSETNADVTAGLILEAKRDKDFSAFVLPDGSTPTNWGQFKQAALGKDKKNLGIIVSGHADPLVDDGTLTTTQEHGNGKDKNKDKSNNGNGKGKNP